MSEPTTKKEEDIDYFTQRGMEWGIHIPKDSICSSAEEAAARKKENSSAEFFVWRTDNGSGGQYYYFWAKDQEEAIYNEESPTLLKACLMDWQKKATAAAIEVFKDHGMGGNIKHIFPENVCYSEQDAMIKLKQNPSLKFCMWPIKGESWYDFGYAKNCLEPKAEEGDSVSGFEAIIIKDKINEEEMFFKNEFSKNKPEINLYIKNKNISISREHAEENLRNSRYSHLSFLVWREGGKYYCWEANKEEPRSFDTSIQLGDFLTSANLLEKQKFADDEANEKMFFSKEMPGGVYLDENICLSKEHARKKREEDLSQSFLVWKEGNEQESYKYYFWKKGLSEPESCDNPVEFKKLIQKRKKEIEEAHRAKEKALFKEQINNAPLDIKNICYDKEEATERHKKDTAPTFLAWREGNEQEGYRYYFWRKKDPEGQIISYNTKDEFENLLRTEKQDRQNKMRVINMHPPKNWTELEEASTQLSLLDDDLVTDDALESLAAVYRFVNMQMPEKTRINDANEKPTALNEIERGRYKIIVSSYPNQDPKDPSVRGDFWALVKPGTYIFDLNNKKDITTEDADDPLTPYYPLKKEEPKTYQKVSVQLQLSKDIAVEGHSGMSECTYNVTIGDSQTSPKQITRISYEEWPDHGTTELPTLTVLVDKLNEVLKQNPSSPPIVHCRAGFGRSGVLVAACFLKREIEAGSVTEENLEEFTCKLIFELRAQRGPQFVQTDHQFNQVLEYGRMVLNQRTSVQ